MPIPYRINKKYALLDDKRNPLTEYVYDMIVPLNTNLVWEAGENVFNRYNFIAFKNERYGLLNGKGIEIVPCIFKDIKHFDENSIVCIHEKGDCWIEYNLNNILSSLKPARIYTYETKGANINFDFYDSIEKLGYYINDENKKYDSKYIKVLYKGQWYLFDNKGRQLTKNSYDNIDFCIDESAQKEMLLTRVNNVLEITDLSEKTSFKIECESYSTGNSGLIIENDGKYGYIDFKNSIKIPTIYDNIHNNICDFAEIELFACRIEDKWEIFNSNWKKISNEKFDEVDLPQDSGLITVNLGKWGVIDRIGNWVIKPIYDEISSLCNNNYFIVRKDGKEALFHYSTQITDFEYDSICYALENRLFIHKNNKFGIMDLKGKIIVPPKFINLEDPPRFSEGLAVFGKLKNETTEEKEYYEIDECLFGFINENGEAIIPSKYEYLENFREGFCRVFSQIELRDGFIIDCKYEIMDTSGRIITNRKYDYIMDWNFVDDFILVKINDDNGWIDRVGREYFED